MADGIVTTATAPATRFAATAARWMAMRPARRIAAVYLAARLLTTILMLVSTALSPAASRFGPDPSLVDYILGWDGQWYWTVAVNGYPTDLPTDDSGQVSENAWAFLPVYPFLAKLFGNLLGAGNWWVGALVVSLVAGYLACLALHALLRSRMPDGAAMWAVAFFASGPLAVLFQVGYAESLFIMLLLTALLCVAHRRWRPLYALIPLMGFTRPGVLAFALFLGLYGLWRLAPARRRELGLPRREVVHVIALGALATAVGFAWQVIAAVRTGRGDAYLETELAWRRSWGGAEGGFVPLSGWFEAANVWSGVWGIPSWLGAAFVVVLAGCALGAILFLPRVRALGGEVQLWSLSYLIYLLAVFFPQSSVFRLLLPFAPLAGAVVPRRSLPGRVAVLAGCIVLQWIWLYGMYGVGNTFWLIP